MGESRPYGCRQESASETILYRGNEGTREFLTVRRPRGQEKIRIIRRNPKKSSEPLLERKKEPNQIYIQKLLQEDYKKNTRQQLFSFQL
jgi:hypothetical protein